MSKLKTAISLLSTPGKMILPLAQLGFFNWMPDAMYLKFAFRSTLGTKLYLNHPVTFSEKIQWLKLHDRKMKYIDLVDKIKVKEIVAEIIGQEYIIPTIGTWERVEDIDFSELPDQFVLKCNHDSGSIVICRDKSTFDIRVAQSKLKHSLSRDSFYMGREWPYKYVKRMVLAEPLLQNSIGQSTDLIDYKFFCFNEEPSYCQVITDRSTNEKIEFYNMMWEHQPFVGLKPCIGFSNVLTEKPKNFDKMVLFSSLLCKDTFFSRIDFYEVQGKLYFGEITLYPMAGFGIFTPTEWNDKLGEMIKLPIDK